MFIIRKFINYKEKLFILLIALVLLLTACSDSTPELLRETKFVLGTLGNIQIYSSSPKKGNEALTSAYGRITDIENTMSTTIENSDIYRLNANAGVEAVEVSPETLKVIHKALDYYEVTNGTFSIGLGALLDLWGISKVTADDTPKIPTEAEIEEAKNHVDLRNLEFKDSKIFIKDPNMTIDLGGIAKGYAVDEAANILQNSGFNSGFVDLGGDIYVLGPKPDGTPWKIGIQTPEIGTNTVMAGIELTEGSIVTSGDYQRYFIDPKTGRHYHHIINPATGYPTDNNLASVTIVAKTALEADILSTTAFVMGLEEGLKFIEALPGVEGIFVTKEKLVYTTSDVKDKISLMNEAYQYAN
ncbi:FAD:protein FMN transferase [Natronincola ferrireducens]|uniref:FAD:protein FMN transferase n=1 Tax=Natronincola ferrireducens TaxID=393762 RepID=UPI001FCC4792|nr:FAD:protein FMN transferase [Natronincola ferrireducens]